MRTLSALFRRLSVLKPDYHQAVNLLARAYKLLERYPEAASAYQEAIRLAPNDPAYHYNLGNVYVDMRRKAEAMQMYNKLQKIDQANAKELKDGIELYLDKNEPGPGSEAFAHRVRVNLAPCRIFHLSMMPSD